MPEKWPTKRVDESLDTEDSVDFKSLYSDDMTGHKTGTGLLFRPEAHDERMYATFLKQEVRYTRDYPYAKSVMVLAKKDHLLKTEPDEDRVYKKPNYKMTLCAIILFFPLGLFALIHYMRALSAYGM